jgi:predicted enzyme related to lactoylglutathione lyase
MAKARRVKKGTKKVAKKKSAARRPRRAAASSRKAVAPKVRSGLITHTELASADPPATRAWCQQVLGWKFGQAVPTPSGPYHMWRFENDTGGGIRATNPPEVPGSIPYCEVAGIQAAFSKALAAGAAEMLRPQEIPGNMGWIAIVMAPGGVPIGFWSMK